VGVWESGGSIGPCIQNPLWLRIVPPDHDGVPDFRVSLSRSSRGLTIPSQTRTQAAAISDAKLPLLECARNAQGTSAEGAPRVEGNN